MITLLLHLLRLVPFLFGGHRQLALDNLALRQQLAVYRRTVPRPRRRMTERLLWAGWPESGPAGGRRSSSCRPTLSCDGSGIASATTGPGSPASQPEVARQSPSVPWPVAECIGRRQPSGMRFWRRTPV